MYFGNCNNDQLLIISLSNSKSFYTMDIRELKLFRHLSGSLHFGRTSRACNVTPSALTRTIQRLENEIGEKLFIRDKRSVALTPAGDVFKEYAEDVIQRWTELQSNLSVENILKGDLSLYSSVTAVYGILPRILSRFRKEFPGVHINLQTGDAARALITLQNGEVDVSIAALPDKQPTQLECLKITETPLVFIVPKNSPETVVFHHKNIDWSKTPIIMAEQGLSRERVERWFFEKNVVPNIYAHVAGNEAIIAMVSLGCGVGIVPLLVLEKSPFKEEIEVLDVTPQLESFSIGVCTLRKNMVHPRSQAFLKIVELEAGE